MKRIFGSSFESTPSFDTDVRKTFQRVRRDQAQVRGREARVARKEAIAQ
jgi:hypothetical protein